MGIDARMFVRTMTPITEAEVKRLAFMACACFEVRKFLVWRPERYNDAGQRSLTLIDKYEQDGPDIVPESGETFIEAHLMGRYWGAGYERGDIAFYVVLAEWLERVIPGGSVWYGGDSSGICASPFNATERARYLDHLASENGADYFQRSRWGGAVHCDFCDADMPSYRTGPNGDGYICAGCNLHVMIAKSGERTQAVGKYPDEVTP